MIAWQRVSGRGTYLPLKSNEIKYFYALTKEERHEKSLKIMIKYLKIMIQYKSKENFGKKASSQTSDLIPNADPTKRCCKFERVWGAGRFGQQTANGWNWRPQAGVQGSGRAWIKL